MMASIWFETKARGAFKVVGNLSPSTAVRKFPSLVTEAASKVGATVEWKGRLDAILHKAGMDDQLCYVELNSPPSAPEANQPKRLDHGDLLPKGSPLPRGVIVCREGIEYIGAIPQGGN